jgi:hypothetical protein
MFFALAWLACTATLASAQAREVIRDEINLRGTVEAVDHAARTVRIRGDQGNVVTIDVPQSVTRFDQVKVGDIVTVQYYDRVNLRLKPADEPSVDRTVAPTTTPTPGALPGATVASQRVTTVTLTGWDPATRVVTFTGPTGASYSRRLLDTTDASVLAGLKVGDRVDVTRTEAANLSVQSAPQVQVVAEEGFRDRLTFSASWGWDNQFSGQMIQAATGQTTTGVPINLQETTYDDVYGRMGIFKVGVGYRTSPRSEAVINLVISRSGSETANIGTVGVANVPVNVDFDDYNYWGFEGGQRFYFARVRFTPYLGYLVGINRFDDIRGLFVDLPPTVSLPGYEAQEGKFFEKSWAFSFGPTGGVLIGVGPFEVMAETQLRYMGGLSDVDWLVEEGLRDINSESSRWSFPISLGARIRF